jgi:hypothetical protein
LLSLRGCLAAPTQVFLRLYWMVDMAQIVFESQDIDWELLQQQKLWLVGLPLMRGFNTKPQADRDAANGLIHFLDAIQDAAAKQLGQHGPMIVFGTKT